ncbi:RPII140-upstream gene protein [Cylas formicarius]|uniref:RPII140-upstream gene protein n=1 Tax=Cylas formicarius TaxID=197179 RepID=UPI0029588EA2|nr:RPII140-upstream gene protein [Cylas formicarius]
MSIICCLTRRTTYGFLPFVTQFFEADRLSNETATEQKADKSSMEKETGWDRLKRMFRVDEFGNISHEANAVIQVTSISTFVGAILGGIATSKATYLKFMEENDATSFQNHFEAKKKLQDMMMLSFGKGSVRFGLRAGLFSAAFIGSATAIQTYRGASGVMDFVLGGALAGFLYRFNMGPRAWLVAAPLGASFGLVCGVITHGILSVFGMSMDDMRYWQYQLKESRSDYIRKGMREYLDKENLAVIKMHDDQVGEAGKHIDNVDKNKNPEL